MFYITVEYVRPERTHQLTLEDLFSNVPLTQKVTPELRVRRTVAREELTPDLKAQYTIRARNFTRACGEILTRYSDSDMWDLYDHYRIPKRSGGTRPIDAPKPALKADMEYVLRYLNLLPIYPHTCAYAYVNGRTHADAARKHAETKHKYYLKLDMHNFFGSCNPAFIETQLMQDAFFAQLDKSTLSKFIHLCTLKDGLPQGTPLSPWLTNVLMRPLDFKIAQLCKARNVTYTRYADDMHFSYNNKQGTNTLYNDIKNLLRSTPLQLNEEKTKTSSLAGQTHILGLTISNDSQVTVNNKNKERSRAMIWDILQNPEIWTSMEASQALGKLNYYIQIEPAYFNALIARYKEKTGKNVIEVLIDRIKNAR